MIVEPFIPRKGQVMISTCPFKSSFKSNINWTSYIRKGADLTITEIYIARDCRRVSIDNYYQVGSLLVSKKTHEIQFDMGDLTNGMRFEFRLDNLDRVFTQRDINKVVVPYLKEKELIHEQVYDKKEKK